MNEKTKIFFCEDDDNLGLLLKEYLDTKGFETHLFRDGEEGLHNFEKTEYDLCILDGTFVQSILWCPLFSSQQKQRKVMCFMALK